VAYPGCLSRIPDPDFYPSRIPDPKTVTEERRENFQYALKYMVWDPGSGKNLFRILDPGVKKAPDPGSGSATLVVGYMWRHSYVMMCTVHVYVKYLYIGTLSVKFNRFYGHPQHTFPSPANVRQLITGTIQYDERHFDNFGNILGGKTFAKASTFLSALRFSITYWIFMGTFDSIVSKHAMRSNRILRIVSSYFVVTT
jgi:hypothetical protein